MFRAKNYIIRNIAAALLTFTSVLCLYSSAEAEGTGLKPTDGKETVLSAYAADTEEEASDKLLNTGSESAVNNSEYSIEITCKAQMIVPDAGIDAPMEAEYEECLSGWFYDQINYAFSGVKSVSLNGESTDVIEYYYGDGSTCYKSENGDWYEDGTGRLAEFIVYLHDSGEMNDEDCTFLAEWIFPDYSDSINLAGDMFLSESSETSDGNEIIFSLKDDQAAELQINKEHDRYTISELTVKVHHSEYAEKQTVLSDHEKEILNSGLYDTTIRNGYRNYNSGRDKCCIASDGSPFFPVYSYDRLVSIEKWEGSEHTGGTEQYFDAFLSYEGTLFEISWGSETGEYYIESNKNLLSEYEYVLTDGVVTVEGTDYPYLLSSEQDFSDIPEKIYSAIDVDNRFIIKIEITHEAGSMDSIWTAEEAEQLLADFITRVHVTPIIKTVDQIEGQED